MGVDDVNSRLLARAARYSKARVARQRLGGEVVGVVELSSQKEHLEAREHGVRKLPCFGLPSAPCRELRRP